MRTILSPGQSRPDSTVAENRFARSSGSGRLQIAVLYTSVPAVDGPSCLVRDSADLSSTARDVSHALRSLGHQVKEIDFGTDARKLITQLSRAAPQIVVNLAEQPLLSYDKEPHAATLLELLGLPYTGNGPAALSLCKNKAHAKQIMLGHGVPTPRFYVVDSSRVPRNGLTFPLVVKPLLEDGSLGINDESVVTDRPALRRCVANVLRAHRQHVLVEEFASGREFNVVVLGNGTAADPYRALPPGEYVYHSQQWRVCTFLAKWDASHPSYAAVEAQYPAKIPPALSERLKSHAIACARIFELSGYARIDLRLDASGSPQVLEVNPNPDLSPDAGTARTGRVAGMSYPGFLQEIVRLGLARGAR
jgi:D-alanine-D-alanine ligase